MSKSGTKLTIQLYFNGKFSNFHHFNSLKSLPSLRKREKSIVELFFIRKSGNL